MLFAQRKVETFLEVERRINKRLKRYCDSYSVLGDAFNESLLPAVYSQPQTARCVSYEH